MNIDVTKNEVKILNDDFPHENEYKIRKCHFTFDEFTEQFPVKMAIFTSMSTGEKYETNIVNNECDIPVEVLKNEYDTVKLGVYSFETETIEEDGKEKDVLKQRTSPSYDTFTVPTGSYEEGATSPEMITPSQYDIYSEALQGGLDEIDDKIEEADEKIQEVDDAIERTNNLDLDAERYEHKATVVITKKDGTEKSVDIYDGEDGTSLENMEIVDSNLEVTYGGETHDLGQIEPNVQVGSTTTVAPNVPARVINTGTTLNPIFNFEIPKGEAGAIKFQIVEQLPTTDIHDDTIYLVPYTTVTVQELPSTGTPHTIYVVESTGKRYVYESNQWIEITSDNKYVEYIYVNNAWEELGSIGVDIDLSDYYTKSETNGLLSEKVGFTDYATNSTGGVFKSNSNYGTGIVSNGSLYALEKTYTQYTNANNYLFIGKGTLENVITGKGLVSNTDYATSSVGGVIRTGTKAVGITDGRLYAQSLSYSEYNSASDTAFLSKGTLENVIIGKDLTTKAYVDGLVGDIATTLDTIQREVI